MDENEFSVGLLFDWIDNVMIPMLGGGVANLVTLASMVAGPAVVLYFVVWAIRQINDERPYTELMWQFFKLCSVMSFGLNADFFTGTVISIVNDVPQEIAAAFSGAESTTNLLDQMINNLNEQRAEIWDKTEVLKFMSIDMGALIGAGLAILIVYVLGGIYVALATLVLFVAKLVVMVIVALGPIFVVCAFFKATNNFFTLWVNQLVNYMLLFVIFSMVFTVQATIVQEVVMMDPIGRMSDPKLTALFMTYIVAIGTITIIPMLASSLSGGVGLNGVVGGTATAATSLITRPGTAAAKLLGRKATSPSLGRNSIGNSNRKLG